MQSPPIALMHRAPTTPWAIAANGAETEQILSRTQQLAAKPCVSKKVDAIPWPCLLGSAR